MKRGKPIASNEKGKRSNGFDWYVDYNGKQRSVAVLIRTFLYKFDNSSSRPARRKSVEVRTGCLVSIRSTNGQGKLCQLYGLIIQMFFKDHAPPHFHVKYAEHKAIIDIRELALIEGKLPRRALGLVLDWAELHQTELLADWQLCQDMQSPKPIAPLE